MREVRGGGVGREGGREIYLEKLLWTFLIFMELVSANPLF